MVNEHAKREALEQLSQERLQLSKIEKSIVIIGIESPELRLAQRSSEMAKMWLGKGKQFIGAVNPYPSSRDAGSPVIEPPAQDFNYEGVLPERPEDAAEYVAAIKALRKEMEDITGAIFNDLSIFKDNQRYQISIQNAWTDAQKVQMYLGLELGRIFKAKEARDKVSKVPEGTQNPLTPEQSAAIIGESVFDKVVNDFEETSTVDTAQNLSMQDGSDNHQENGQPTGSLSDVPGKDILISEEDRNTFKSIEQEIDAARADFEKADKAFVDFEGNNPGDRKKFSKQQKKAHGKLVNNVKEAKKTLDDLIQKRNAFVDEINEKQKNSDNA